MDILLYCLLYLLVGCIPFYYGGLWPSTMIEDVKNGDVPREVRIFSKRTQLTLVYVNFGLSLLVWPMVVVNLEYKRYKRSK